MGIAANVPTTSNATTFNATATSNSTSSSSTTSNDFQASLFFIQTDKMIVDASATDKFTTSTLEQADDASGAITALGWLDPIDAGLKSGRIYYAKNGTIQEMVQKGDEWSTGSVLALS